MRRRLKAAVVGLGEMGRVHLANVLSNPDLELIGLVSRMPGAEAYFPKVFASLTEATDCSEIDFVIISNASPHHADLVVEAVSAGLHVLCEKPVAFTERDIDRLTSLPESDQSRVLVGFNRRLDRDRLALKTAMSDGGVGHVEFIQVTSRDPFLQRGSFSLENAMLNTLAHDFDAIEWLTGQQVKRLSAFVGARLADRHPGILVQIETSGGILGSINVSFNSTYGYDQRLEVYGTEGMIAAENPRTGGLVSFRSHGERRPSLYGYYADRYVSTFRDELKEIAQLVTKAGPSPISATLMEGCRASRCAIAAIRSVETGCTVDVLG